MPKPVPARLHVLLARDCPKAVIIRRGPSRHTAVIGWDRSTHRFSLGQWLYGRIYERRCDLSPDGRHLIVFAMNGRWSAKAKGSWTAVSQAPWLKALDLHAKGDCWHGGGLFLSAREYWLNDGYGHERQRFVSGLACRTDYPWDAHHGGECPGVYYLRLQRDGWRLCGDAQAARRATVTTFEKPIHARWTLRKLAHATWPNTVRGRGCYYDEHSLVNVHSGQEVPCSHWEWAEGDGRRLWWASAGKLFEARLGDEGPRQVRELADFNDLRFEAREAPY